MIPWHHTLRIAALIVCALSTPFQSAHAIDSPPVAAAPSSPADFPLVRSGAAARIVHSATDAKVVEIASRLLADDIQRVSGVRPEIATSATGASGPLVLIGTIGETSAVAPLIAAGKIDVSEIQGGWERYRIQVVKDPFPGVPQALVVVGSDRRGTAFGVLSLSEAMGISPWTWWADVPAASKPELHVSATPFTSKEPSVRYRGIFINDEDWGLQPWAAKTLEPETNDIGPKTYAKVCELLLRLKANYLWPAMHESTAAFNSIPENKRVADDYAIVMGSSHAEPILFNNATEWKLPKNQWNYVTHADVVKGVWEKRLQENGKFENTYTIGMRGIHDSPMQGGKNVDERRELLERVFADQRQLIARYVNSRPELVPQIFVPYKEVLPIYRSGLKVPEDVTLVWVDDNHGYIRQLSNPEEQKRGGRAGVYYHLSYWGAPEDYLWLGSTSPALTAYEMLKAYAYGADRVWVFNVGDIKSIEKEMEFGLRLAYDVERWPVEKAMDFLDDWAARTFGAEHAGEIAGILTEYYHLTARARPEHRDRVTFTEQETAQRLAEYHAISQRVDALYAKVPDRLRDAFFQLVLYPVKGAALMDRKHAAIAQGDAELALKAYEEIQRLTEVYNKDVADGKWRHVMSANPRRRPVFSKPDPAKVPRPGESVPLFQLSPKDAALSGGMKLVNNAVVATAPGFQQENTSATATFTLQSPEAQKVDIYFLAKCPDPEQDSWFVSLNDRQIISKDHPTGTLAKWIKIMEADLQKGANKLVIAQREPGTEIRQVAIMEAGKSPRQPVITPAFVFAAADFSKVENNAVSQWKKIEGLGIEEHAMTLLPYETQPIPEADLTKAPAVRYAFQGDFPKCVIESRFLPTHHVNPGMGLRYAISVDDGPPQIRDINAQEKSSTWASNVLNGYSAGMTTHEASNTGTHTITIRLLDPGMVLSQVRVSAE